MKSSFSLPSDCAQIAPQLTALFDGEADEIQAQQARAHLLSCPACSRSWLDWTQHRAVLQSEPVPTPPPTLLWRVLIAYRVAAFAQPARCGQRLPLASATALRELEAPLPPRFSEHILARTTRKPNVHVMLTPLDGALPSAKTHWNARASRFRRVSAWAAPALALWILLLGRGDFTAILPRNAPATTSVPALTASDNANNSAPIAKTETTKSDEFAPVPIVSLANASQPVATSRATAEAQFMAFNRADFGAIAPASLDKPRQNRVADETMNRVLLLAMNAGRRDVARAQSVPGAAKAPAISTVVAANAQTTAQATPNSQPSIDVAPRGAATTDATAPRAVTIARPNLASRVGLAALTSPLSSIRTTTAARLRSAVFSGDSLRPRTTDVSAGGRRLARAPLNEGDTPLRVSRPNAAAPTLREVNFKSDNGPRLEDVRSAVDDFRASVASEISDE